MSTKIDRRKETLKETIENKFLYSDTIPATAGKFLLAALTVGPVIIAGAIAPNMFSAMSGFRKRKSYTQKQVRTAYNNLRQRKLIEIIQEKNDKFKVQLTTKGQRRVKKFCFESLKIEKPKKWDKKWRILIFDIPSKPKIYNQAREALRRKIKELGFHQIQKSVWTYPYECEDEILFISELFEVQKYIEIITAEKLLHEDKIKKIFDL